MNENNLADVLIIARGGGSLEDLWPFNEEVVARAIYESNLPIISAVGHETDFTIADFVADLRAPTPSAAAELAVSDIFELKQKIDTYDNRYKVLLKRKIELMKLRYEKCMKSRAFTAPTQKINDYYITVDKNVKIMINNIQKKLNTSKANAREMITKLDTLSPLKTLTRGYCLAQANGKIIKSIKDINENDIIGLTFQDGSKQAKILN